jgi:hypothetical protein
VETSRAVAEIKAPNGHNYLDEPKAAALALMQRGLSARAAALELGLVPRTVERWAKRWQEVDPATDLPILMENWTRIVYRAQQLMHDWMDNLEEHPEEIGKSGLIPNVYAGTGTDKLFKARDGAQPPNNLTQVVVVLNCQSPEDVSAKVTAYIEGEATALDAVPDGP